MNKKFTNDRFSYNINLFAYLMTLLPKEKTTMLEIGSHEGLATSWLLENNPKATVYAIDPFVDDGFYGDYEANFDHNVEPRKDRLVKMKGYSVDTLRQMSTTFDYVYIDGAHDTKSVMSDIMHVIPLLKKKSIIHFDDYEWKHGESTPKPAIDWFLKYYEDQIKVIHKGYQIALHFYK